MKKYLPLLLSIFFIIITIISCKPKDKSISEPELKIDTTTTENKILPEDTIGEGLPIFYNMYLSVELSSLFKSAGVKFNNEIISPYSKYNYYTTSEKKALNIGIYAVDLSYTRYFEQYDLSSRYFSAMQKLAEDLGIPAEYFHNTAKRFENNINNKDSLIKIANEVYKTTENYLKENDQQGTAALIIIGGWIEAIYLGAHIALETEDINIIERLAEQKYSLENLLKLLNLYIDDSRIKKYYEKLSYLYKNEFNNFILGIPGDFNPEKNKQHKKLKDEALKKVKDILIEIEKLRKEIQS